MARPKISIVMSVYNDEDYLEECIQSVLTQSFTEFEFIIVDDGSSDSTQNILERNASRDKRISLIHSEINQGQATARNIGINCAKGEYIAIMDSDDISHVDRLKIQSGFLDDNPDVYIVGGSVNIIDSDSRRLGKLEKPCDDDTIRSQLISGRGNPYVHPTVMFRNTGEFRYRGRLFPAEDYDLYLNMITRGKILANVPDVLLDYRIHEHSCSFVDGQLQKRLRTIIYGWYLERKKSGTDSYATFSRDGVSERLSVGANKINHHRRMLDLFLKIGNVRRCRIHLKKLRSLSDDWKMLMGYSIAIRFPSIYKFYRRVRFGKT